MAQRLLYALAMRETTEQLESISIVDLATVTGGCKRKSAPCAPCCCPGGGGEVDVTVSTGGGAPQAQGGQPPQLI